MSTKIRLMRIGRKKLPFYRIVVTDSRNRRGGEYIDLIGTYNPLPEQYEVKIDEEKALKWLNVGALPTDTAKNLMSKMGIIKKFTDAKVAVKTGK